MFCEALLRIFERKFVDVGQHQPAARFSKKSGSIEADTARSTGNQHDFIPEVFHSTKLPKGERGVNKKLTSVSVCLAGLFCGESTFLLIP